MSIWYKQALLCSILPLLAGLTILLLWWRAPSSSLEIAGFVNIIVGLLLFVAGCIFLIKHHLKVRQSEKRASVQLPLFLLFLNFPVAFACVHFAMEKYSESSVKIINTSPYLIRNITIKQREGSFHSIKDVVANEAYKKVVKFKYEGDVTYSMMIDGREVSGLLFGYVTPSMGSHAQILVGVSGNITVEEKL